MRAHVQLGSCVVDTPLFDMLSVEARLLYVYLAFESDKAGRILNARRVVRGLGFDAASLDELVSSGFLFELDGTLWMRDHWLNNTYKKEAVKSIDSLEEFTSGVVTFSGEPWRSSYVLSTPATKSYADATKSYADATKSSCNSNGNGNDKGNSKSKSKGSRNGNEKVAVIETLRGNGGAGGEGDILPLDSNGDIPLDGQTNLFDFINEAEEGTEDMSDADKDALSRYLQYLVSLGFDAESTRSKLLADYAEGGRDEMFKSYISLSSNV